MAPQAYKVVRTHYHEISVWTILSRLIHLHSPHLGWMNGDVHYDLSTLAFNNGEQLEYFHSIIIRLQQGIILSGESLSPTIIIFQYTEELSKSNKLKAFIASKMKYLIILIDNNGKSAV